MPGCFKYCCYGGPLVDALSIFLVKTFVHFEYLVLDYEFPIVLQVKGIQFIAIPQPLVQKA